MAPISFLSYLYDLFLECIHPSGSPQISLELLKDRVSSTFVSGEILLHVCWRTLRYKCSSLSCKLFPTHAFEKICSTRSYHLRGRRFIHVTSRRMKNQESEWLIWDYLVSQWQRPEKNQHQPTQVSSCYGNLRSTGSDALGPHRPRGLWKRHSQHHCIPRTGYNYLKELWQTGRFVPF